MGRLVVLDASVVIAALAVGDVHHAAAMCALDAASDDELVVAATTRAEVLIGPLRRGGSAPTAAMSFLEGCASVPVSVPIADAAAIMRARHGALSLPDAITLAVAETIDADAVWTFDRRWSNVDARVVIPSGNL